MIYIEKNIFVSIFHILRWCEHQLCYTQEPKGICTWIGKVHEKRNGTDNNIRAHESAYASAFGSLLSEFIYENVVIMIIFWKKKKIRKEKKIRESIQSLKISIKQMCSKANAKCDRLQNEKKKSLTKNYIKYRLYVFEVDRAVHG